MKVKFPKYTLLKLVRKNSNKRISSEALNELNDILLDIVEKTTKKSIEFANHAHRLTVKKEDVELATR